MNYHKTQLLGTLSFEKHWANPKTDSVDPYRTKNEQNAPSCSVRPKQLCVLAHLGWTKEAGTS